MQRATIGDAMYWLIRGEVVTEAAWTARVYGLVYSDEMSLALRERFSVSCFMAYTSRTVKVSRERGWAFLRWYKLKWRERNNNPISCSISARCLKVP